MLRLILVLFGVFAPTAILAADPAAEIPYRIDYRGWYTIEGTINGKGPFDFIIDTGATRSLIFANAAAKVSDVRPSGGAPISVLGLSKEGKFPTFVVDEIEVGGERFAGLVTVVLSDWVVDGRAPQAVLGLDFLARYHVEFDADRRVMRLYRPAARYAPPGRRWTSAKMRRDLLVSDDGPLFTTEVRLNGWSMPFMIDLGATGTIVNEVGAARGDNVGVQINDNTWTGASRVTDALSAKARARMALFQRMRIGGARWNRIALVVYDAPILEDLGVQGRPFGLIGAPLFADRSFAFDFKNGALFIGPSPETRR